jgi:hypothetical protein
MKNLIQKTVDVGFCTLSASLQCEIVETLMRSACRHCKSYASDLYYDIMEMSRHVQRLALGEDNGIYRHVVSIREGGVDGPRWTQSRLAELQNDAPCPYGAMFIFEVKMHTEGDREYCIQTLYRVDVPKMRLYLQTRFDEDGNYKKEDL